MPSLSGIAISPGIAIGPVFQFGHLSLEYSKYEPDDPGKEWTRFEAARAASGRRLQAQYEHAQSAFGSDEAAIFGAQLTILDDPELLADVREQILRKHKNAESALYDVSETYCERLEAIEDEYIRARVVDLRDVRDTMLAVLLGFEGAVENRFAAPSIVVSRFLTPSDCISMDRRMILGFCTMDGSTTSHVAILARSLGLPAVAGVDEAALAIPGGAKVILDGYAGTLIDEADGETVKKYEVRRESKSRVREQAKSEAHLPAMTLDGHQVLVVANLGSAEGAAVQSCIDHGAEGVGLLRTEFVYLECQTMPDEDLQYEKYRTITQLFGQRPVILRTIDIGGDKNLPYFELPHELNPFLGVRGLRLSLRHPEMFKAQLKAALRAGYEANLQLMFPMVTKASELRQALRILAECKAELAARPVPFAQNVEVGIMIEVPAAALLSEHLAEEVDFFSIGTNDLSQYTLAADRTNNELSQLVDALDPAVLGLISQVIDAAHKKGKRAGVCGELAGEPVAIPILLGLGLDEFSMNPPAIPLAKRIIRRLRLTDVQGLARRTLKFESPVDVRAFVLESLPGLQDILSD